VKVDLFDFVLPPELIPDRPACPRDSSRLLDLRAGQLADRVMRDLPELLQEGDLLVFNDTRVIPARLKGLKGGSKVEVTLHQRIGPATWRAFARPAKKLAPGVRVDFAPDFFAEVTDKGQAGEVTLTFNRTDSALMQALELYGVLPLPPYMKREADARDRADYQTLLAARDGAVAAPTAGLHFTPELLAALDARGVNRTTVTLHVGAGTFLPVKVENTRDHVMHAEWGEITSEAAAAINAAKRVVAVGTTSLRLLESATGADGVCAFSGETSIFITPGYTFKAVDVLLTNFHLPRSTLFMLVCAFAGTERMKDAYAHAIAAGYRFYSYGDACLLEP